MLNNCPQENIGSHQKMIPYVQGQKRCHSRMVGGVKLHLESNPSPTRDARKALANFLYTRTQRPHRDLDRTVFECLLQRYWSSVACYKGRGSGCSILGFGISPLGGGHHCPTSEPEKLTQTLGQHKQSLVGTRTQDKGAVTPQKFDSALSMSVQESLAEVLVGSCLLHVQRQ